MTAVAADITKGRITIELNQLTCSIMTNNKMVVVLNHYVLQEKGVYLQQKITKTQDQKVLPVQQVHKGRSRMKEVLEWSQRGDNRDDE